jgi:hypothetical protein
MRDPDDKPQEEILDAARLPVPAPDPDALQEHPASEEEAGLSDWLDLPSLQKSLVNDEAERRTRQIHRFFKSVFGFVALVGLCAAAEAATQGKPDEAALRFGGFLCIGTILGGFLTVAYAMVISPVPDISGAEELARRRRRARKAAAKKRRADDNSSASEAVPAPAKQAETELPTPKEIRRTRLRFGFKVGFGAFLFLGLIWNSDGLAKTSPGALILSLVAWVSISALLGRVGAHCYANLLDVLRGLASAPDEELEAPERQSPAAPSEDGEAGTLLAPLRESITESSPVKPVKPGKSSSDVTSGAAVPPDGAHPRSEDN